MYRSSFSVFASSSTASRLLKIFRYQFQLGVQIYPMTSPNHLDDEDDFGGDFSGTRRPGSKRSFGELDDEKEDIFGSKKGNIRLEETAPGAATGTILSLRESLKNCEETLATCQSELEAAKSEIQKWHSSFLREPFIASGSTPEPRIVVNYLHNLRSSEELLQEQLEKAKKKEAAFIVNIAKRDQEISELKSSLRDLRAQLKPPSMQARKLLLDPAIHEEFTRLKNLVDEKDKKVKELQDNIAAVNFTPQSKNGKLLMAKCRTLQEENEEIGNQANEGKMHDMAMKLALQKSQNAELKSHLEGLCKQIEGLTNDVEISNEMVFILQEKLEEKDADIRRLTKELEKEKEPLDIVKEEDKRSSDDNIIAATNEEVVVPS